MIAGSFSKNNTVIFCKVVGYIYILFKVQKTHVLLTKLWAFQFDHVSIGFYNKWLIKLTSSLNNYIKFGFIIFKTVLFLIFITLYSYKSLHLFLNMKNR